MAQKKDTWGELDPYGVGKPLRLAFSGETSEKKSPPAPLPGVRIPGTQPTQPKYIMKDGARYRKRGI